VFLADILATFGVGAADGSLDVASSTVADLTGKAPQSAREYLAGYWEALLEQSAVSRSQSPRG
jgi:hypothetical protein